MVNLAYVGSKGTHLTVERQLNQLHPLPCNENPFGPNEPLTITDCTVPMATRDLPGMSTRETASLHSCSRNGTQVTPQNPAYMYLQAACTNPNIPNVNSLPGRPYPGSGKSSLIAECGQFELSRVSGHDAAHQRAAHAGSLVLL